MTDVGGVPVVTTGHGDSWGGGLVGLLLVIALLGGRGFGGLGGFGGGCGGGFGGFPETRIENRMDFDFIRSGQFELQKDIAQVGFLSEKNTGAIIHNQDVNTGRILERMAIDREFALTQRLNEAERLLSEQRITATVLGSLQPPRPIPAYQVANPYESFRGDGRCFYGA